MVKKLLLFILCFSFMLALCGCADEKREEKTNVDTVEVTGYEEGDFTLSDGGYVTKEKKKPEENTISLIEKAKKVIEAAKCEGCDFSEVSIVAEEDAVNKRKLYTVKVCSGEKNVSVSFKENDGKLVKFSSGMVVSDSENPIYTADKVDELLEVAKGYYKALDVEQSYELSGWQMDFSGPDWQVEFTRKIDIAGYEKAVYNYGEQVRMRISGSDGKLLSVNVFDTPLNTEGQKEEMVSYETALAISELDEENLEKSYIGCYTLRDKGYARLCWCFEADLNHSEVCNTKWVYIDLYTGEIIGEESCH